MNEHLNLLKPVVERLEQGDMMSDSKMNDTPKEIQDLFRTLLMQRCASEEHLILFIL